MSGRYFCEKLMAIRAHKSKRKAPLCRLRRSLRMPQRMLYSTAHLLRLKITCGSSASSVAKAFAEFDEAGRMKPSAYYDRVVDVMEELVKFTLLTRDVSPNLVDRYSERNENVAELSKRVNQRSI